MVSNRHRTFVSHGRRRDGGTLVAHCEEYVFRVQETKRHLRESGRLRVSANPGAGRECGHAGRSVYGDVFRAIALRHLVPDDWRLAGRLSGSAPAQAFRSRPELVAQNVVNKRGATWAIVFLSAKTRPLFFSAQTNAQGGRSITLFAHLGRLWSPDAGVR